MERIQIIGFLGKDAEVKEVNNQFVLNFNVAVSDNYKNDKGETIERTTWYQCARWFDKRPKVAEYLLKGVGVYVEGKPSARWYKNGEGHVFAVTDIANADFKITRFAKDESEQGGVIDHMLV